MPKSLTGEAGVFLEIGLAILVGIGDLQLVLNSEFVSRVKGVNTSFS